MEQDMEEWQILTPEQKDRVRLLIHELRTTDKWQGVGKLHRRADVEGQETYCCLGIACVLAVANEVIQSPIRGSFEYRYEGESAYLPCSVTDWFGFKDNNPLLMTPETMAVPGAGTLNLSLKRERAAVLNDNGVPFSVIADLFEQTYVPEDVTSEDQETEANEERTETD